MPHDLCVVVHGFTGNPSEVAPLGQALKELGYDVVMPLLPGHNLTKARMERVEASNWINAIDRIIAQAKEQNRVIHMVGFSMGAMIAALMAKRFSLRSLVLLSPSVYVVTPNVLLTRTKKTIQLLKQNHSLLKSRVKTNLMSARSAPLYNVYQFNKVIRQAKKAIPYIDVPVCIIHGLEDEIVDPISSKWIFNTIASHEKELHHLHSSGHLVCHSVDSDMLIETVCRFLQKHSSGDSVL